MRVCGVTRPVSQVSHVSRFWPFGWVCIGLKHSPPLQAPSKGLVQSAPPGKRFGVTSGVTCRVARGLGFQPLHTRKGGDLSAPGCAHGLACEVLCLRTLVRTVVRTSPAISARFARVRDICTLRARARTAPETRQQAEVF